jgi:NDP-sugar pyrophosphorylase family protein
VKPPRPQDNAVCRAGIIAAGHGSRLADSHPGLVKPLVPIAGRPLCHWVAASLRQAGVQEITLLHNSAGRAVRESLERAFPDLAWTFLQADTASSWESFRLVSRALGETADSFLVSTVDALVPPADAARFARLSAARGAAAGLALTAFVDDEKPLWADLDDAGFVTALGEACTRKRYVTSGLYFMTAAVAAQMPEAQAFTSLRRYWMSLLDAGVPVAGEPLSKTLDVDRPEDVAQAEGFLKEAIASW